MTAKARGNPMFQAFDGNGDPLSGGALHTYEAGTTTPKDTFQDPQGTAKHPNPVVLDSRGEAAVYWGTGTYKLVLKDAGGATVWTLDDFDPQVADPPGPSANLVNNGSFEQDSDGDGVPDSWLLSTYAGGTATREAYPDNPATADPAHGEAALLFVSAGAGGGWATGSLFEVEAGADLEAAFSLKSTVANVRNVVELAWYGKDRAAIPPNTTLYDEQAANPTAWARFRIRATPPAGACFAELVLTGCHNSVTTLGETRFDHVTVREVHARPVRALTANATLTRDDAGLVTVDASGGAVTVTLPPAADEPGMAFTLTRADGSANAVTVDGSGADTIDGRATFALVQAGHAQRVVSDGTGWRTAARAGFHNVQTATANRTLTVDDRGTVLVDASSAAVTLILPAAADLKGMAFAFVAVDATNAITVQRAGTDTIDGAVSFTLDFQNDRRTLGSDGSGAWHAVSSARAAGPSAPSGYLRLGQLYINDEALDEAGFDVKTNVADSTWESVGPTGSGADNIWTALDSVPSTAIALRVRLSLSVLNTSVSSETAVMRVRKTGSSVTPNDACRARTGGHVGAANHDSGTAEVAVPTDANGRFDIYIAKQPNNTLNWADMQLGGWYDGT